ncbi:MAG: hypothetical protein IK118_04175 [Clostridia bacterium]|nr:hypothetical protein [Clostridia bacterium]
MDFLRQAFELLFPPDKELLQIIGVTMRMSFSARRSRALSGFRSARWSVRAVSAEKPF